MHTLFSHSVVGQACCHSDINNQRYSSVQSHTRAPQTIIWPAINNSTALTNNCTCIIICKSPETNSYIYTCTVFPWIEPRGSISFRSVFARGSKRDRVVNGAGFYYKQVDLYITTVTLAAFPPIAVSWTCRRSFLVRPAALSIL